jgi:hypothetical protein
VVRSVTRDARGTEELTILGRRGQTTQVSVDDVLAAKVFPR